MSSNWKKLMNKSEKGLTVFYVPERFNREKMHGPGKILNIKSADCTGDK